MDATNLTFFFKWGEKKTRLKRKQRQGRETGIISSWRNKMTEDGNGMRGKTKRIGKRQRQKKEKCRETERRKLRQCLIS